jgi:hypothetical protein
MIEITAPGTYTVRFGDRLSTKRFADAKKLVADKLSGTYDPATRTWAVTLDESDWDRVHGAGALRTLAEAYGATVAAASDVAVDRAALIAERRQLVARLAEIDRILDES